MSMTFDHVFGNSSEEPLLSSEKQNLMSMLKNLTREKNGAQLLQQFLEDRHSAESDSLNLQLELEREKYLMMKRENEILSSRVAAQKAEITCVTNQRDGVIKRYKELFLQHRTLSVCIFFSFFFLFSV